MQNVKGTCDYFGKEQALRRKVLSLMQEVFELYDFDGMDTAVLNELELLTSKYAGGDEIVKEMYTLTDQGKRKLGLRYDLTIPFAKVIALNPGLEFPYKRYEIGKVFRDGPVKRGRMREFMQCDADVVGIEGPEAEAELMQLAVNVFRRLDIPIRLRWNNRRFLAEVLEAVGVPGTGQLSVMLTLDKIAKIGPYGIRAELIDKGMNSPVTDAILELIGMEAPSFEQLCAAYGVRETPGAHEVLALRDILEKIGIGQTCLFDPFLSRGLSFYTGTVYEIFDASGAYSSSLGGGGRYDSIIGQLIGRDEIRYPTVGLSFGMESIMEMLAGRVVPMPCACVCVIPIGSTVPEALLTANRLRSRGIRTTIDTNGRKLKKSLAAVSAKGIPYAVLIGEAETSLGKVRLKDMNAGTENLVTIDEAAGLIAGSFQEGGTHSMKPKFVRIQTRYCGKTGKPVGIFGACWHLLRGTMRSDCLNNEDADLFLAIREWFEEHLPNPPFYEDGNTIKAVTWFKTDAAEEMLGKLEPLMELLEKYQVRYDVVYTNQAGEIIYEDRYQVGVI